jgi:hypothetical protein
MNPGRLLAVLATTLLLASLSSARADGPAVSTLNGKLSSGGGAVGSDGHASGLAVARGSLATPLGQAFGLQVDGTVGTAFNIGFGAGTAHLFWRDPEIGMFGPIATMAGGIGIRLGWYGAEAEYYAGMFTFGAWGGYHDVNSDRFGIASSSGYYGGRVTAYPIPDLALSLGAGSEFNRVTGIANLEFQPDLFARRNVAFYVNGAVGESYTYVVTAGFRLYFGPDKSLIRRHREDDPVQDDVSAAVSTLFGGYAQQYQPAAVQANIYQPAAVQANTYPLP